MAKKAIPSLIDKTFETVEKIGVKNTIQLLDLGQTRYHDQTRTRIDFIINQACNLFNIKRVELLNTRTTKNERTEALAICYFVVNKKVNLSATLIAQHFEKNIAQISRGIKRMRTLDVNHPFEGKLKQKLINVIDAYEKEFGD